MTTYTVTDDKLCSDAAAKRYANADRRILIGVRDTLEILGIPVPDYAKRKTEARTRSCKITAAYAADNPHIPPAPLTYRH